MGTTTTTTAEKAEKTGTCTAAKADEKTFELSCGKVARVILYVTDMDRAVKFYGETLGLKLAYRDGDWAALETEGTEIDLHGGREPGATAESYVAFHITDLDATYATLKARGLTLSEITSPCSSLRHASFKDPDGNCLGIEGK